MFHLALILGKIRDHCTLHFPDGPVFSWHSTMSQEPVGQNSPGEIFLLVQRGFWPSHQMWGQRPVLRGRWLTRRAMAGDFEVTQPEFFFFQWGEATAGIHFLVAGASSAYIVWDASDTVNSKPGMAQLLAPLCCVYIVWFLMLFQIRLFSNDV